MIRGRVWIVSEFEKFWDAVEHHVASDSHPKPMDVRDVAYDARRELSERIHELTGMRPMHNLGEEEDLGLHRHRFEAAVQRRPPRGPGDFQQQRADRAEPSGVST